MSRETGWTPDEVERLKRLYPSETSFEEIVKMFPSRTPNALRMKASRLGLERPSIPPSFYPSSTILLCTEKNGGSRSYLFRCSNCGSWIKVRSEDENNSRLNICRECGAACYLST